MKFSPKTLLFLQECGLERQFYVYGLIDPRTDRKTNINGLFYIGKGCKQRVFDHKFIDKAKDLNVENLKIETIKSIESEGKAVKRVIFQHHLTESEALAAETSLINAFKFIGTTPLSNLIAGHNGSDGAKTVEEFDREHGAIDLCLDDIFDDKDSPDTEVLCVIINNEYDKLPNPQIIEKLHDIVRGCWRVNENRVKKVKYVFGVYKSLVLAVYSQKHGISEWHECLGYQDLPIHVSDRSVKNLKGRKCFTISNSPENSKEWKTIRFKSLEKLHPTKKGERGAFFYLKNKSKA